MPVRFRIDQATRPAGVVDQTRHDLVASQLITLTAVEPLPGPGVTYEWEIIDRIGPSATLSADAGSSVTMMAPASRPFAYLLELRAYVAGVFQGAARRIASSRTPNRNLRVPLFTESADPTSKLGAQKPEGSTDNAVYDDLSGSGESGQNWRGFAEAYWELVRAVDEIESGGGTGDVTGPGTSTDNAVVRFNGADGVALQNSAVTIDDAGNIVVGDGRTVDGRDVSADGTKLDGIEAGAQTVTLARINTATGRNATTDGAKLDGIEAGAQVTSDARVRLALANAAADIAINGRRITGAADPQNAQDVATRAYVLANAGSGGQTLVLGGKPKLLKHFDFAALPTQSFTAGRNTVDGAYLWTLKRALATQCGIINGQGLRWTIPSKDSSGGWWYGNTGTGAMALLWIPLDSIAGYSELSDVYFQVRFTVQQGLADNGLALGLFYFNDPATLTTELPTTGGQPEPNRGFRADVVASGTIARYVAYSTNQFIELAGNNDLPGSNLRTTVAGNLGTREWGAYFGMDGSARGYLALEGESPQDGEAIMVLPSPVLNQGKLRPARAGIFLGIEGVQSAVDLTIHSLRVFQTLTATATAETASVLTALAAASSPVAVNGQRVTGVGNPVHPQDAATRAYVQQAFMSSSPIENVGPTLDPQYSPAAHYITGETPTIDLSGNGRTLTAVGTLRLAPTHDGVNATVQPAAGGRLTSSDALFRTLGAFTAEFTLYLNAIGTASDLFVVGGSGETEDTNFIAVVSITAAGELYAYHESGAGVDQPWTTPRVVRPGWNHIVFTRAANGRDRKYYVNGQLFAENVAAAAPTGGTTATMSLMSGLSGINTLQGQLAQAAFWSAERTADEIRVLAKRRLGINMLGTDMATKQYVDAQVTSAPWAVAADINFAAMPAHTITDGANMLDNKTWTGVNIATGSRLARINAGSGLQLAPNAINTNFFYGERTSPHVKIKLADLIPDFHLLMQVRIWISMEAIGAANNWEWAVASVAEDAFTVNVTRRISAIHGFSGSFRRMFVGNRDTTQVVTVPDATAAHASNVMMLEFTSVPSMRGRTWRSPVAVGPNQVWPAEKTLLLHSNFDLSIQSTLNDVASVITTPNDPCFFFSAVNANTLNNQSFSSTLYKLRVDYRQG